MSTVDAADLPVLSIVATEDAVYQKRPIRGAYCWESADGWSDDDRISRLLASGDAEVLRVGGMGGAR
jgi:hypothetical protein